MEEVFKPIIGYEGIYEVSNFGRVKSLGRRWSVGFKSDTFLREGSNNGYKNVTLSKDKIKKTFLVHRLVATYFCDNPNGYDVVNHLNSCRGDNRSENLEWTTVSGNAIHGFSVGFRKGRGGELHHNKKLSECDILAIRSIYSEGKLSQREIGLIYGVNQNHVSRIVLNKRWSLIS